MKEHVYPVGTKVQNLLTRSWGTVSRDFTPAFGIGAGGGGGGHWLSCHPGTPCDRIFLDCVSFCTIREYASKLCAKTSLTVVA